jgi:hypothetical protein
LQQDLGDDSLNPRAFGLHRPVGWHLVDGGAGEEAAVGLAGPDGHGAIVVAPDEVVADIEGLAALDARTPLIVSDNDFGCEGKQTRFYRLNFA